MSQRGTRPNSVLRWTYNTIAFTSISNQREVDLSSVSNIVKDRVLYGMISCNDSVNVDPNIIIPRTIGVAYELLDDLSTRDDVMCDRSQAKVILGWVLDSLGVVNSLIGQYYDNDMLISEAHDTIIAPIQGNKQCDPTTADLDLIVNRTIRTLYDKIHG